MVGNLLASLFTAIGGLNGGPSACWKNILDEPEMPKSMIER